MSELDDSECGATYAFLLNESGINLNEKGLKRAWTRFKFILEVFRILCFKC